MFDIKGIKPCCVVVLHAEQECARSQEQEPTGFDTTTGVGGN